MASTPTVDQFLGEISQIVQQKAALRLQDYLIIEPPYSDLYHTLINEIRSAYPKGNEDALETKCSAALATVQEGEDNATWTSFVKFMAQYLSFLRDVNIENLLDTYNLLSELVQKCNSALGHPTLGVLLLPTVIAYSRVLARLAIGLDKQPHLIAHLNQQSTDESGARETLPERAANIIRQAFVTCLNDRVGSSGGRNSKPEGKKAGIYKVANLCLKVLFQCKKTRNAEQMFVNIDNQSPPISNYPRSERVTYLYYLGRFHFSTNHFWRAQLALQEAYKECHLQCFKQKRLILIYLVASNIILGRFPSAALLNRKEAYGLREIFLPICTAMKQGDLATFHQHVGLHGPHTAWLSLYRVRLQLKTRCEIVVWRSLFRKTFLISGFMPSSNSRSAPTFTLNAVLHLANFLLQGEQSQEDPNEMVDPDLSDAESDESSENLNVNMLEIESIASSLVVQKLLNGFVSHRQLRFAITGAKRKPALEAGFPNVWETIQASSSDQVPGWVRESRGAPMGGAFGPGMVVNLKGSRPVGVGA